MYLLIKKAAEKLSDNSLFLQRNIIFCLTIQAGLADKYLFLINLFKILECHLSDN